jgi:S1-C subfamily serine protease
MRPARAALLAAGALLAALGGAAVLSWLGERAAPSPPAPPTAPPPAPAPERVFARASPSVVTVYAAERSGRIVGRASGVVVEPDLVVTTCHAVARANVLLLAHRGKQVRGRLAAYDAARDLCMLHASGLDAVPARIGSAATLRIGQRVYAIGTPEGFELTLSEGLVSGLRETEAGRYIQTTAPLSEGSSGGGLFDETGSLVGIAAFVYSSGQNLNFAAPAEWALELARKVSRRPGAAPEEVELPAALAKSWRPPLLR